MFKKLWQTLISSSRMCNTKAADPLKMGFALESATSSEVGLIVPAEDFGCGQVLEVET